MHGAQTITGGPGGEGCRGGVSFQKGDHGADGVVNLHMGIQTARRGTTWLDVNKYTCSSNSNLFPGSDPVR